MAKNRQKPRLRNQVAHHAINTVVPSKRNNYRPYLTNRYGMAVVIAMVFAVCIGYIQESPAVLGSEAAIQPAQLLEDVNEQRAKESLPRLSINPKLTKAAQLKAEDMVTNQYWSHVSPSGVTPWKWVNQAGYHYAYAGENLAKNFATAGSTVAAWMASDGHRKNLMHEYYTDAGFAVIDGELNGADVTIVVGLFATPATSLTTVAGATTFTPGTNTASLNPFARFGIILQSSGSTTIGVVALALIAFVISIVAFVMTHWQALTSKRRQTVRKLPPLHKNRPAVKLVVMTIVTIGASILLGGGQI